MYEPTLFETTTPRLSLTHSLSLTHPLSLSLSHSLSHSLTLSHSLSLTHTHTLSLSLSLLSLGTTQLDPHQQTTALLSFCLFLSLSPTRMYYYYLTPESPMPNIMHQKHRLAQGKQ